MRGGQPLLLSDNGYLSLKTALAAFDSQIADLPGVKPKPGEVGKVTEATYVVERIDADVDKLSSKQRAVFDQYTTPAADAVIADPANPKSLRRARRAPATPQEYILARRIPRRGPARAPQSRLLPAASGLADAARPIRARASPTTSAT